MTAGSMLAAVLCAASLAAGQAGAAGTGLVFVSNEKSNTISVLDGEHRVVVTIETCARPRGMHFSADRTMFYVGCADDSLIAVYDVATRKLVKRIRNVEEPETFDLPPDGRHLYVSHEEHAAAPGLAAVTGGHTGRVTSATASSANFPTPASRPETVPCMISVTRSLRNSIRPIPLATGGNAGRASARKSSVSSSAPA